MAGSTHTAVSIVLEWETGEECGRGRADHCLAQLNRQMWEGDGVLASAPELILVKASHEQEPNLAGLSWPGRFEVAEAPAGSDYYQKKNFGFSRSRGEIVLFVDSDLAPEPGWLAAMLRPFVDPAKSVVVGRTHFDVQTIYQRAVALFWIFEARVDDDLVRPTRRLVSNNIAFRRPLFAALPFPERPTYRGQCSELGATINRLGIVMVEATAARASHPAPSGLRAFTARALRAGRDALAYRRMEGPVSFADWRAEWRRDRASMRSRRRERAPVIGAGPASRLAAAVLGHLYYGIKAAAFLAALLAARRQAGSRSGSAPTAAV